MRISPFRYPLHRTALWLGIISGLTICLAVAGFVMPRPAATAVAGRSPQALCPGAWVFAPPDPISGSFLRGVDASSPADVWTVGNVAPGGEPLLEHWNGSAWANMPAGGLPAGTYDMYGMSVVSPTSAWAVGQYAPSGQPTNSLILHWDGSQWTTSPAPVIPASFLRGVRMIGGTGWAVGGIAGGSSPVQPLILFYDGSTWVQQAVQLPAGADGGQLMSVDSPDGSYAWAVGTYTVAGALHSFLEYWNGTAWVDRSGTAPDIGPLNSVSARTGPSYAVADAAVIQSNPAQTAWAQMPVTLPTGATLRAIAAQAGDPAADVWAVGWQVPPDSGAQSLTIHWDGVAWTTIPSPTVGTEYTLNSVWRDPAGATTWAVGRYKDANFIRIDAAQRWDCTTTPTVTGTPPTATGTPPTATPTATGTPPTATPTGTSTPSPSPTVTGTPPTATATRTLPPTGTPTASTTRTLTPTGTPTTVPTRTPTSVPTSTLTPTVTPTNTAPPTGTPTPSATTTPVSTATPPPATPTATVVPASATPCPIRFTDVNPADYFYTPVLYLACQGVISGYADGTYRPYNNTTRAQQVKIVVLSFGVVAATPAAGTARFADVPPAHPFFTYVEAAAQANIISGYNCGGPGEPCDANNRPYFRPYANVTRGQLAKIVVAAAGWAVINPAAGTFSDVLPGTAFYSFVETAVCHGVISGYNCGGPGEPCDGQNRPYFRQNNQATRGQIAKIVYLARTAGAVCAAPGKTP